MTLVGCLMLEYARVGLMKSCLGNVAPGQIRCRSWRVVLRYVCVSAKFFHEAAWRFTLADWRAQRRVLLSNGCKTRHGKSRSHVAWMAGGDGNVAF